MNQPFRLRSFRQLSCLLGCSFLALSAITARAANGIWTNAVDAPDSFWSATTNWLNGAIADGADSTATFSNELGAPVTVNLDTPRTIGNLDFQLGSYTITNNSVDAANVLTLSGASVPVVLVPAATASTIRRTVLAGSQGFVLDGGGQLNLFKENTDLANTITGTVVLSNGTIQVQGINVENDNDANTLALNSITSFTFYNGTLNFQPQVNTSPQYGNVNGNFHVPEGGIGTIVLPVRVGGAAGDNSAGPGNGIGGNLTGSGTFNVRSRYVRGNVVGDWSAFTGLLDIGPSSANADNAFRFGNPAGYPNARVNFSGTTPLSVFYYRQLISNTNIPMGVLSGDNPQTFLSGSASAAFTLFYEVGALHTSATDTATFAGTIGNAAGPAGLIKRGAGTLILLGNNTYTGPTLINEGVLQIGDGFTDSGAIGTGPVTNNGALIFARGSGPLVVTAPIAGTGGITNTGVGGTLTLAGTNTYSAPTISTAGRLIIGTASRATGPYVLTGAAEGFGVLRSAPNTALTVSGLSFAAAGSFDVDLGAFNNPTGAAVTNTGNLALNGNITVNVAGSGVAVGTITLLQYESRSGSGSFVLGSLPPQVTAATLNDDVANKRVTLTVTATFDDTLRWVGDANGIWDVGNTANQIWRVVGSGQLTNYYDGAKVRFDDTATGTTTINVSTIVSPASVTVNNAALAYKFAGAGAISSGATLIKQGNGTLTVANVNDYTGFTLIDGGTLQIGDGLTDGAIGAGVITNSGTLLLNLAVGPLTMANVIHGTGNVVQAGAGQVNLSGASTYSGGLTIKPGTTFGYNQGNAAGIGGGVRVESGVVVLGADIFNNVGAITVITNAVFRNTGANRVIDAPISGTNVVVTFEKTPNIITVNRTMAGISGVITNTGTGLLRFNSGGGNNATGSINALWVLDTAGGFLQARNGSVNALGAVTGVGTISAQQSGSGTTTWVVGGLNTSTTFEGVISDGASFNQLARYTAVAKTGTGTWTLSNVAMTHRSSTSVSNGVLALTGTTSPDVSTNIVVAAPGVLNVSGRDGSTLSLGVGETNQTLRGDGTIIGNVVLGANARLLPGFSAGTLTINGNLTLGGSAVMELDRAHPQLSDRVVATAISGTTSLVVTNIGPAKFAPGDKFQLFNHPVNVTLVGSLPALSCPGLQWNNRLSVDGSLEITGTPCIDTTPTNITVAVTGNQLDLQWPDSHKGWELQTNAVSVADPNSWFAYPPSLTTNRVVLTIDPTKPNVYYRLRYQVGP